MATRKLIGLGLILFSLLVLFSIWKFNSIFGVLVLYPLVYYRLVQTGMNFHLAVIISFGIIILTYYVLYLGIFMKNRKYALMCIAIFFITQSAIIYFAEKDILIKPNGKSTMRYNYVDSEYHLYPSYVLYDPDGNPTFPVTPEIAQKINMSKKPEKYPINEIAFGDIKDYFDPITGKAKIYYYKDDKGEYHFFKRGGYDPQTGKELLPVTGEVVQDARKKYKKEVGVLEKKYEDELTIVKQNYQSKMDKMEQKYQNQIADMQKKLDIVNDVANLELVKEYKEYGFSTCNNDSLGWYIVYQDKKVLGVVYVYDVQANGDSNSEYKYNGSCQLIKGKFPNDRFAMRKFEFN